MTATPTGGGKRFDSRIVCAYLYVITKYGYPPPAENTVAHLEEMAALGFSSVELEGIRAEHLQQMSDQRTTIGNTLDRLNLQVPYFCVVLPGLSSPEKKEREENLKLFGLGCETAIALGAKGVLDNGPLPPYRFPGDIPVTRHYDEDVLLAASLPDEMEWGEYWDDLGATFRQACDIAAKHGLTYEMHPALGVLSSSTDSYLYFQKHVDRDNLRFNLDTANQFAMKDNIALSVRRLVGQIDYIHLSDNRGDRIEHRTPGDGNIDWTTFFHALKVTGYQGLFGLDIGGAETGIEDIDSAYVTAAEWLEKQLHEGLA